MFVKFVFNWGIVNFWKEMFVYFFIVKIKFVGILLNVYFNYL